MSVLDPNKTKAELTGSTVEAVNGTDSLRAAAVGVLRIEETVINQEEIRDTALNMFTIDISDSDIVAFAFLNKLTASAVGVDVTLTGRPSIAVPPANGFPAQLIVGSGSPVENIFGAVTIPHHDFKNYVVSELTETWEGLNSIPFPSIGLGLQCSTAPDAGTITCFKVSRTKGVRS